MTNENAKIAPQQDFIACTIARDIARFPHLIAGLHHTLGPAWGHLDLTDAASYLRTAPARALGFVVVALRRDDPDALTAAGDAIHAAHTQSIPVLLATDLPIEVQHQVLRDQTVAAILPLEATPADISSAIARLSQASWDISADAALTVGQVTLVQGLASGCGTTLIARSLADTLSRDGAPACIIQFSDEPGDPRESRTVALGTQIHGIELPHAGCAAVIDQLPHIIASAAQRHAHVIVDMPPVAIPAAARLMPIADHFLALAEITPRAAQNTRSLRQSVTGGGRSFQDVRFVLNRATFDTRSQGRAREMAAALCIDFANVLPDAGPVSDLGRIRPGTALAQAVAHLAADLAPTRQSGIRAA